ncbi:MAG: type II toxin-antitoxin system prevent-host-death family antitoxin [Acidobacteriia bacterium]|nr:type II toxin-antitoxin system prevent-host-death family antitoxin [Terriglobia bacterium]
MHDAKSSLSRLVKRAASGEEILIAKNGKPMARLTRLSNHKSTALIGAFAGWRRILTPSPRNLSRICDTPNTARYQCTDLGPERRPCADATNAGGHLAAHRQRADRLLIAQARAEGMALATSDDQIRKYRVPTAW